MNKDESRKQGLRATILGSILLVIGIALTFLSEAVFNNLGSSLKIIFFGLILGGIAKIIEGLIYIIFPQILINRELKFIAIQNESEAEFQQRETKRKKRNKIWIIILVTIIIATFGSFIFLS